MPGADMRGGCLSLVRAGFLVALLGACDVLAAGNEDPIAQLRKLVDAARDQLAAMREQVNDVDAQLARVAARPALPNDTRARSVFEAGGSHEYSDLKRSATRLADIGNQVLRVTSGCGDESRDVGRDFRAQTRQLQSAINRIGSAKSAAFARMSVDRVRHDVGAAERQLQIVGQISLCVRAGADDQESSSS